MRTETVSVTTFAPISLTMPPPSQILTLHNLEIMSRKRALEIWGQISNLSPCTPGHPCPRSGAPLRKMGTAPYFSMENRELSLIFRSAKRGGAGSKNIQRAEGSRFPNVSPLFFRPAALVQETPDAVHVLPEPDGPPPGAAGIGVRAAVYPRGPGPADGVKDVLRGAPPREDPRNTGTFNERGGQVPVADLPGGAGE